VLLTPADSAGESTYNPFLAEIVDELVAKGIAVESDGALCVFFDGVIGPDGDPVPLIVRKADGGFGYAATDLATIRHRVRNLKADRILYVVDARQALHFRMVFDAARRAGWLGDDVQAIHVPFGTVLGPDGRPFKTRSGGTVRLGDLLDAAVERAREVTAANPRGLGPDELERVVHSAGIGAVKYAELSTSRTKDYVFDVDRMVSLSGDTGVYLQYAHARIQSILDKLPDASGNVDPSLALHPAERALALALDEFTETLTDVALTLEPHRLCGYLYALARAYTGLHENCPVLRAENAAVRGNRVALCRLTGRTLAQGLRLLGIEAPARM
jgi:arginyl-tRNA synthetase